MWKVVVAANVAVAVLLGSSITVQVLRDREREIERAAAESRNLAEALAEQTRQTFGMIDLGLRTVVDSLDQARSDGGSVGLPRLHEMLEERQTASVATLAYVVLDEEGTVVANSTQARPAPADLSGTPTFRIAREGSYEGMYMSPPTVGRLGNAQGRPIVSLSRRIEGADGEFAGLVAAVLSIDYLLDFYDTVRPGHHGAVALLSEDGVPLARSPANSGVPAAGASPLEGDPQSGEADFVSARASVPDFPLIVYTALAREEILDPWRGRLIFAATIGVLVVLALAGASGALAHYYGRQRRAEVERSRRLKLLAEETAHTVHIPDIDGIVRHVTEVARSLIGARWGVTTLALGGEAGQARAVSFSPSWVAGGSQDPGSVFEVCAVVADRNRPVMMSQAELQSHPVWAEIEARVEHHPPVRGLLVVPTFDSAGNVIGHTCLSDKEGGEFVADDLNQAVQLVSTMGIAVDNVRALTQRNEALAAANAARAEIENIFSTISDSVLAFDREGRFIYLNAEADRMVGRPREELLGRLLWEEFPHLRGTLVEHEYRAARQAGRPASFEFFDDHLGQWFAFRLFPHESGLTAYVRDITQQRETEDRLRQAQKMDAIGQLTGGVAHDFNNLLTVILGNADIVVDNLAGAPEHIRTAAETILKAGERAAELTHRLLAFARRQPLEPRTVDVDALIGGIETMVRRTLGEDIEIDIVSGPGLWKAMVDAGELENAILNLAINSRDAMPGGGRLTIETANVAVDATYARFNDMEPGRYVLIVVSDTGLGMEPDTVQRAFEPFFTTKVGTGSGLGLSMVYGFARQSGGHVRIYSEPGEGTSIRLYLPRSQEEYGQETSIPPIGTIERGTESILVVEDDDLVRQHTVNSLKSLGYAVAQTGNGAEALALIEGGGRPDLVLTDVVLPGSVTGRELAEQARLKVPALRVLFMSGYTQNAIVHHGRLDPGVHLLSKPFRLTDLARKVREVLDAPRGA